MFERITDPTNLLNAWRKVRANRGAAGIDSVSIRDFERDLKNSLTELSRNLTSGSYQPLPARFVEIRKRTGGSRELGILTIRDRVAQRAVLDAIEPILESEMLDCSFAFRGGRNVEMAIERIVAARANGFVWTVETDVENFFPSIDRDMLTDDLRKLVDDQQVLQLIELWLEAGILEETWWRTAPRRIEAINEAIGSAFVEKFDEIAAERSPRLEAFNELGSPDFDDLPDPFDEEKSSQNRRSGAIKSLVKDGFWLAVSHRALLAKVVGAKLLGVGGVAAAGIVLAPKIIEAYRRFFHPRRGILQGAPLSPVLANLYLTDFDRRMDGAESRLVRYADDLVILCRSESDARKALRKCEKELARRRLRPNPAKTRIAGPEEEFEFLGYRFPPDAVAIPPSGAPRELIEKIRKLSREKAGNIGARVSKFKATKHNFKSWKEFFDVFGDRK